MPNDGHRGRVPHAGASKLAIYVGAAMMIFAGLVEYDTTWRAATFLTGFIIGAVALYQLDHSVTQIRQREAR